MKCQNIIMSELLQECEIKLYLELLQVLRRVYYEIDIKLFN